MSSQDRRLLIVVAVFIALAFVYMVGDIAPTAGGFDPTAPVPVRETR